METEQIVQETTAPAQEKLSRQQRRQLARKEVKKKYMEEPVTTTSSPAVTMEQINSLVSDLRRVLNYVKLVDNHVWMLVETMNRKNILGWTDVNETEQLYLQKEQKKQAKIKDLLSQSLSVEEYLTAIKDEPTVPGWERLDINPIKDLNLNPFEVALYLKDHHPDMTVDEVLAHYKVWGLGPEHFGIQPETKPQE